MRGKVDKEVVGYNDIRITPAHAGKRNNNASSFILDEDHPRTCGEKAGIVCLFLLLRGSPPHMRGKGIHMAFVSLPFRITPAHAGKS